MRHVSFLLKFVIGLAIKCHRLTGLIIAVDFSAYIQDNLHSIVKTVVVYLPCHVSGASVQLCY